MALLQGLFECSSDNYEAAEALLTTAIAEDASDSRAFAARAGARLALERHAGALQDANTALGLDATCEIAQHRKGVAAFQMDEFETAKAAFEAGAALPGGDAPRRKYRAWIRKCDAEMDDDDDDDDDSESDVDMAPPPPAPPAAAAAAAAAAAVPMNDDEGDDEGAAAAEEKKEEEVKFKPTKVAKPISSTTYAPPSAVAKIKYQYYQNDDWLTIQVLEEGLSDETLTVEIDEQRLFVSVKKGNFDVVVLHKKLFEKVIVDKCKVKYRAKTGADIKLRKTSKYEWHELGDDAGAAVRYAKPDEGEANPKAAAYASGKDWAAQEKALQEELDRDKPEGEEALNELFRGIYGKATDETRRAMNKSFQTSGGTVLSTNWGEVGTTDYESSEVRQAPKGMKWETYNGDKVGQKDNSD